MSKSPPQKKPSRKPDPLRKVMDDLVIPVFQELAVEGVDDAVVMADDGGRDLSVHGILEGNQLVFLSPQAIDHERTLLRVSMVAGMFIGDIAMKALLVGTLLEDSLFHVQAGFDLGRKGEMLVGCDLVVRADDGPLLRQRLEDLLCVGYSLDWFFPLRMPNRLRWSDLGTMEIEWEDLPHGDLDEFLADALQVPPAERTPVTLVRIAQALGQWKDVLRLMREHPDDFADDLEAPLKVMALRELGRWLPATEVAEQEGGLVEGRYDGAPWISPSYLHASIEAGRDIEALRILGQPGDDEPGFYDWLRGLALHRAGDFEGAEAAFDRYFDRWPRDVIGFAKTGKLSPGQAG